MLVEPKLVDFTKFPMWEKLSTEDQQLMQACEPEELRRGVYDCVSSNFHIHLSSDTTKNNEYPSLITKDGEYMSPYGVCDDLSQILALCPYVETSKDRYFTIALSLVQKKDQPGWGGWRWHKWGPYIGVHEPQTEYLYNEPIVERVVLYHIYEIDPSNIKASA